MGGLAGALLAVKAGVDDRDGRTAVPFRSERARRGVFRLLAPVAKALAVSRFAAAIKTKLSEFPARCTAFELFLAAILVRVDALITPSGSAVVILVADAASL
jgi:hypothetical protein